MRTQHDRASRLDGNQDLVDRRRGRVGRRDDGSDDAERLGNFDHAPVVVARNHADGFHRTDEAVHLLRGKKVLLDLVGDDPVAGFLDRQPGEGLGLSRRRVGHRVDDGVDALLAEFRQLEPRLLGPPRHGARFGDGGEIPIGWRDELWHCL